MEILSTGTLSVLGFAFTLFWPGYIALRRMQSPLDHYLLVLIFSLSVLGTYVLMMILVLLGLFRQEVVLGVVLLTTAIGIYLITIDGIAGRLTRFLRKPFDTFKKQWQQSSFFERYFLMVPSCAIVVYFTGSFVAGFGDVFVFWDAVFSWNRWAEEWVRDGLPTRPYFYPQLLSSTYAFSYALIGDTRIEYFTASYDRLYYAMLLYSGWLFAGRRSGSSHALVLLMALVIGTFVGDPLWGKAVHQVTAADVPVALFSFLSLIMTFETAQISRRLTWSYVLALIASQAKTVGLFSFAATPLAALMLSARDERTRTLWTAIWMGALFGVAALAWYAFAYYGISAGWNRSNVEQITQSLFRGLSYQERIVRALLRLWEMAPFLVVSLVGLSLISLRDKIGRVTLSLFVPYLVLWAAFLSYDNRNLTLALPMISLAAALGFEQLAGLVGRALPAKTLSSPPLRAICLVAAVTFVTLAWSDRLDSGYLLSFQREKELKSIGDQELNAAMLHIVQSDDREPAGFLMSNRFGAVCRIEWITRGKNCVVMQGGPGAEIGAISQFVGPGGPWHQAIIETSASEYWLLAVHRADIDADDRTLLNELGFHSVYEFKHLVIYST